MGEKRQQNEYAEAEPMAKRPRSGGFSKDQHAKKHTAKPDSSSWAKKRARAIERRMQRNPDTLPANVQQDLERELIALRQQLNSRQEKKQRTYMISKYHMIRFFERKKAMRLEKQLRRRLAESDDPMEVAAIKADLHIAEVDRMYATYFPFMEPYVSLYAAKEEKEKEEKGGKGDEDDEDDDSEGGAKSKAGKTAGKKAGKKAKGEDKVEAKADSSATSKAAQLLHAPRPPIWALVETVMQSGDMRELKQLQERQPKKTAEKAGSKTATGAKEEKREDKKAKGQEDDSDDGGFFDAMSYNQLRAWIEAQEAFERQNGSPAPLTDEQRRAMAVLVPAPMVLPAGDGAMEASTDWISRLMHYEQSRPYDAAGSRAEFIEEPIASRGGGPPYWRCWCRLPREAPSQRFPDADTVAADPHAAVFLRKKDAKKFAAQCAVRWLMAHHYMPTAVTGSSPRPPVSSTSTAVARRLSSLPLPVPSTSPPSRRLVHQAQQPDTTTTTAAALPSPKQILPASTSTSSSLPQPLSSSPDEESTLADYRARLSQPADSSATNAKVSSMASWQSSSPSTKRRRGSDGDSTSNVRSLQDLCQKLGMAMPELRVTACRGPNTGFFDGVAVFLPQKNRPAPVVLPTGVGSVSMVYTREATKEKLAQSVLAHLASAAAKDQ
ncbi:rRNA-processing protein efg1 [Grosmannia clavigera kw1407]|uniref:rRNA-processing protein EFG1 n=1 Tax=Grosmannia clavigera (strain kw1407 / UAMH 11150) TaxID=655863 RepID=F0XQ53_GROCL|nr:rRNA-processing protein efg1 [Grosmannia clavigera kw1407]EFX00043.1 rRNA-processing protein efg1 [Grosmannia clavigera kw1407]